MNKNKTQPSQAPTPQKKKPGCGKWFLMIIIIGSILGLLALCCCGGIYFLVKDNIHLGDNKTTETTTVESSEQETPNEFNTTNINSEVPSIYDNNITIKNAERITLNELILGREAMNLLLNTSWSGDKDDDFPLSSDDFSQSELERIIKHEREKLQDLTIPEEYTSLFHTSTAKSDILQEMFSAREEFISYLKSKNVAQKYIDEIDNNALPADPDRITYHGNNNPDSPPSVTQKYSGDSDFSKREFNLYDIDIYNDMTIFDEAGLLGKTPTSAGPHMEYMKLLRNMGIRRLMYHEMTHVLQRAYITLNVDEDHKKDKVAWIYADKTLVDVDDQYFWEWGGGSLKDENNLDVSQESQAEGISFEVLTNVYNMSDTQKSVLWDHIHGRLDDARVHLNAIRDITESNYPDYSPDALGSMLPDVFDDYPGLSDRGTLQKTSRKLLSLAPYVGYLNAMRPGNTHLFWSALEN